MQYVYTHMSPKLYLNELALVNLDFKVRLFFYCNTCIVQFHFISCTFIPYPFSTFWMG